MKKIIFLLTFILFNYLLSAQEGIIRGKVIDAKTGEELIGATVVLPGTDPMKGTVTDFDGNYTIEKIPVGKYQLVCSFISYDKKIVENVEVKPGDVTIININLGQATLDIEEVTVTAKQIKRTEAALITLQKKAANVIDGISAQQISRLGDNDAASALKRVTGISVQGGKYVYVRGLSDRYSKTTLNDAEIPGLDPNKNTVQMDLFPSNLIENMIVHKTFSPDLPGSFTGGHVNLVTKDFPEKFTFQFSTSMGYNPNSSFNSEFLSSETGKLDWLGFDDGTRELPAAANGQIPYQYVDDQKLHDVTTSFNKKMSPKETNSFTNHSHSVSVGNQVDFLGKKLGFVAGLTYQRGFKYYDDGFVGRYKLKDRNADDLGTELYFDTDKKGTIEALWGAMVNANLKLSNEHKVGVTLLRNQAGESSARYLDGMKISDDPEMHFETRAIQFLERSFQSTQIKGEHFFKGFNKLKVDWLSSYTKSKQDEPDLRYFSNSYKIRQDGSVNYYVSPSKYPVPTRYFRNMEELNFDNKINFSMPFKFIGFPSKVKFGGAFVYKDRTFDEKKISFQENENTYTGDIQNYLRNENIWYYNSETKGIYATNSETSDRRNSYEGNQSIFGTYLMVDLPMNKLRAIFGARFEKTLIETNSLDKSLAKGELNNSDILPALNLTYSATDNMNVRLAVTRTLARPSFRELAPFASFDFVGDFVFVGNPDLKRTLIDNVDIRWEMYMKPGEIISASAFYKTFHDPIERTFNTEAANPELTLRNVGEAQLYGFEVEMRKKLDFIDFLKNFKIGGNFTIVKSVVTIDEQELERKRLFNPEFKNERVMYGQAPYIANIYLNYTNNEKGISSNISYNTTGEQLHLINSAGIPDVYQKAKPQLGFNISKQFGENISLKFSAKNLLDSETKQTYDYMGTEYTFSKYSLGRSFSLGFTYLIK